MRPRCETEIGVDYSPIGDNKMKTVGKISKKNCKVDELRDQVTCLYP